MKLHEITEEPSLIWMLKHQLEKGRKIHMSIKMDQELTPMAHFRREVVEGEVLGLEVRGRASRRVRGQETLFPTFVLQVDANPDVDTFLHLNPYVYMFMDTTDRLKLVKQDDHLLLTNR